MPRNNPAFKHEYQHYADLYHVGYSTIRKAVKQEELNLDDYEACCIRFKCAPTASPGESTLAANPGPSQPAADHQQAAGTVSPAPQPPRAARATPAGKLGLSGALVRLQEAERAACADYTAALESGSVRATALQKQWVALVEALRKAEMASPDVAEQNKKSISADDLERELAKTFSTFRKELENLPRRIENELVGKDALAIRATLTAELEEIISNLYKCDWLGSSK